MDATCTDSNELVPHCRCSGVSRALRWPAIMQSAWLRDMANSRQEIYRHKKTGGVYAVVCNATSESDGVLLVVYRNLDTGARWVRPAEEFNDGRFERVA